jgi:hypothetical protein
MGDKVLKIMSAFSLHACRSSSIRPNSVPARLGRSAWLAAIAIGLSASHWMVSPPTGYAQENAPATPGAVAEQEPVRTATSQFAPGVLSVIAPAPHADETFAGPTELQSLIDAHPEIEWGAPDFVEGRPNFDARTRTLIEMARQVIYRREIYCFEFSFKPLRQIYIDVPQPSGKMARKLVWYMVYQVRYRGGDLRPAADEVGGVPLYKRVEAVSYDSRRVFPMLVLEDFVSGKKYLDRVLPTAKDKIAAREQITAKLHDSIEITTVDIERSSDEATPGVWGVATWEDVDPTIDFLSIFVYGLTNAFRQDGEGPDAPYTKKALQLNFYRPGDAIRQTEDRVRFGVPAFKDAEEQAKVLKQYGLEKRLDYQWVFR